MLPLLERKRHLRALIHADACLRYVDHIERAGTDFYRVAWSTRLGRHCRQAEGWLEYAGLNQLSEDQESAIFADGRTARTVRKESPRGFGLQLYLLTKKMARLSTGPEANF